MNGDIETLLSNDLNEEWPSCLVEFMIDLNACIVMYSVYNKNLDFDGLLPTDLSDKAASYLVNFFMDLAGEVENHYYVQLKRYFKNR